MGNTLKKGIIFAILAAVFYAVNAPFSKILLDFMPPVLMAGFLYVGAGVGMVFIAFIRKIKKSEIKEAKLTRKELPYVIAMLVLDIIAPICLLVGLRTTTAANASLLNNFEIVATAVIALMVFKEKISLRLWLGIVFVTFSCALLSFEDITSLQFSYGSIFVLLAAVFWGFENNCTRQMSSKDPLQIVLLQGIFSGLGSVAIGLLIGERIETFWSIFAVLGVGCVAYGLSIYSYVYAQRLLGAARTSAYYAISPFIAVVFSLLIFRDIPTVTYYIALIFMAIGAWLSAEDKPIFKKSTMKKEKKAIR